MINACNATVHTPILLKTPFGTAKIYTNPYRYSILTNYESQELEALLMWMKQHDGWRRSLTSFYDQYEMRFSANDTLGIVPFINLNNIAKIIEHFKVVYVTDFHPFVTITAHILEEGQGIGIHSDASEDLGETHRLLIQLNHNWDLNNGGQLIFFTEKNKQAVHHVIVPEFGSLITFECNESSYHAVSDIKSGKRYTLVISGWEKNSNQPKDYAEAVKASEEGCVFKLIG